jgi:hypothetical protein
MFQNSGTYEDIFFLPKGTHPRRQYDSSSLQVGVQRFDTCNTNATRKDLNLLTLLCLHLRVEKLGYLINT